MSSPAAESAVIFSRMLRMRLSTLIPSMFSGGCCCCCWSWGWWGCCRWGRRHGWRLAKGTELHEEAEKRLRGESWLETVRGRILDRKGRVLAL